MHPRRSVCGKSDTRNHLRFVAEEKSHDISDFRRRYKPAIGSFTTKGPMAP